MKGMSPSVSSGEFPVGKARTKARDYRKTQRERTVNESQPPKAVALYSRSRRSQHFTCSSWDHSRLLPSFGTCRLDAGPPPKETRRLPKTLWNRPRASNRSSFQAHPDPSATGTSYFIASDNGCSFISGRVDLASSEPLDACRAFCRERRASDNRLQGSPQNLSVKPRTVPYS